MKIKDFFKNVKEVFLKLFCYCSCCFGDDEDKYEENHAEARIPNHPKSFNNNYLSSSEFNYFINQPLSLDAIKRVDDRNKNFVKTLRKQGHRCVYVYETIPTRVGWCQRDKCAGPNYFD